jgi:lipopolysaccharide export system permease protein
MTLARYLTKLFLSRFLAVLLALCALVELLEMLDATRHLIGHNSSIQNVLIFSAMRLPLALEQLFLLAVLIGAVLTFRTLASNNEMTVLRGSGMSPYRLLAGMLPLTFLLAGLHFAIVDRIAPATERAFVEWWHTVTADSDDDDDAAGKAKGTIWLRWHNEIISIGNVARDGRSLSDVTRYVRGGDGQISARIRADSAAYDGATWHMSDVETTRMNNGHPVDTKEAAQAWTDGPPAGNIEEFALPTQRMQSEKGQEVLSGDWAGIAGAAHYRTLIQKSYAAPFLPFLMLLLATPAMIGSGRRTNARGMTISIALGLLYLIVGGFFTSMSEAGVLPAVLAVWSTPLAFAAIGFALLLYNEE